MLTRAAAAAALTVSAALTLGACAADTNPTETTRPSTSSTPAAPTSPPATGNPILTKHGLEGLDARQIIAELDAMAVADRPRDLMASIRPDELILTDEQGRKVSVPMPKDEFYVSVAPYVTQTHDCYFHSLTTCRGELSNTDIQVQVTNDATGETVVDETLQTFDNGFAGLWLPRDLDATLTVASAGRDASIPISTNGADDPTCLTTVKLT